MRRCAGCHQVPRRDDPMDTVLVEGVGIFQACRGCAASSRGEPEPEPVRYPVEDTPPGPGWPFAVCGVCRLALRDDDRPQVMRLHPADVEGLEVEPGCYSACRDCVDFFAPAIHARLVAAGHRLELHDIQGDWLL